MKKSVDCSCSVEKDSGLLNRWLGVLLLFVSMLTPGQTLDTESQFFFETFEPTGADYTLIVSGGMEAEHPVPLVIALHFGGYTPPHYGRIIAKQIVAPPTKSWVRWWSPPIARRGRGMPTAVKTRCWVSSTTSENLSPLIGAG